MKKVGLVTYCEGNFGSVLQCYATQSLLQKKGVACELLRRRETSVWGRLRMRAEFRCNRAMKYLRYPAHREAFDGMVALLSGGTAPRMNGASAEKTGRFVAEHISVRDVSYGRIKKEAKTDAYAAFFSGSDQIWSATWFVRNPWWFLRFAPKGKRVAWCPSFGGREVAVYNVSDYAKYIGEYAYLSTREESGAAIIKQLTGRRAEALSDPVVMLDRNEWSRLGQTREKEAQPYVLLFFLDRPSDTALAMMKRVQEATGKRLLVFAYEHEAFGDIPVRSGDPADFVSLVEHADFVLTDSFHACMFSTIFGTPFFIFNRNSSALEQSERVFNHVTTYGLESRCVVEERDLTEQDFVINRAQIDAVIEQNRDRMHAYLDRALMGVGLTNRRTIPACGKSRDQDRIRVTFISNFISHHQRPFCDAMYDRDDVQFTFVAQEPMSQARKSMGWVEEAAHPYEIRAYESEAECERALDVVRGSDAVIFGYDRADEFFTAFMKETDGIAVRFSERIYKNGRWRFLSPHGIRLRFQAYGKYPKKRMYLLCSSAYAALDYAMLGSYRGRAYRWGYFPPFLELNVDDVLNQKTPQSFLWAGRMHPVKHPETAVDLATALRARGMDFDMNLLGDGPMLDTVRQMVDARGLSDCVHVLGGQSPEAVREYMLRSEYFLATSDTGEGWGAVVNEAMNSGCVLIASDAMGSVPFLLQDGENGLVYPYGSFDGTVDRVVALMNDWEARRAMAQKAYATIADEWNARVAADRLTVLLTALLRGEKTMFESGPCSEAPRL